MILSKFFFPKNPWLNKPEREPIMYVGEVVSINDKNSAGRIRVRIKGVDDKSVTNVKEEVLLEAFPLLPKMFNIFPKIGESVFIINQFLHESSHRYWIGPIISQLDKLPEDKHFGTARSALVEGSNIELAPSPSKLEGSEGLHPQPKEFVINGREDSDILFKESELLLRTGKHDPENRLIFNKKSPGYIQIKSNIQLTDYDNSDKNKKPKKNLIGSVVNVVADNINLISYKGRDKFNLTDNLSQITNDEIIKIIEKSHPLAFGDTLVAVLGVILDFNFNHSHPQNYLPPIEDKYHGALKKVENQTMGEILSPNIKIN